MCGGGGCGFGGWMGEFLDSVTGAVTSIGPAVAGFAVGAPELGAALTGAGAGAGAAASGIGAGLGSLGGAESALGGASLWGPFAGTGTALGSIAGGVDTGLGLAGSGLASGLGMAGSDVLGGLSALGDLGNFGTGSLGGAFSGSGLVSPTDLASSGALGAGSSNPFVTNGTTNLGSLFGSDTGGNLGMLNPTTAGIAPDTALGSSNALTTAGGVGETGTGTLGGITNAAYSPNAILNGPIAATPEGGGISGITPMSLEGSQLANQATGVFSQPTTWDKIMDPLRQAGQFVSDVKNDVNDFLSPIGGLTGLKTIGQIGQMIVGARQQNALADAYQNQLNQINQLYAPDSPYAQQMAQTINRQDAAEGRRSQYATAATNLAAALTQAKAQALGSTAYSQLVANNAKAQTGGLNALLYGLGSLGGSSPSLNGQSSSSSTSSSTPNVMLNYGVGSGLGLGY